jgi:predicted dithiol-disulfide oxidoreductase (DUF899 family)
VTNDSGSLTHPVVSHDEWLSARTAFLAKEKEAFYNYTRQNPGRPARKGVSLFFKDPTGAVFHTYSAYARGIGMLNTAYHYVDVAPKGRDEGGRGQFWVRRHDEYGR